MAIDLDRPHADVPLHELRREQAAIRACLRAPWYDEGDKEFFARVLQTVETELACRNEDATHG